jgi:DNA-binding NarL/FixJ family response regulator/predicted regulator of Ras-like GTPase activity (Roadblock/LC7/MglB family)
MTKVLLVEDSDDHADIITRALTAKKGVTVVRALTVKEAMLHAALKPFDIALVDYRLPDGDGIDLLDSLRAQKPGLPVLFLTAHGSEEVAMRAMSRGAADYVVKGMHYQKDLPARVADVLARSEDLARVAAAVRNSSQAANIGPTPHLPQPRSQVQGSPSPAAKVNGFDPKALARVVRGLVEGHVRGAGVFDAEGQVLSAKLPAGMDAQGFGASLVAAMVQAQQSLRMLPDAGPPRVMLIDYETGLLAAAPVPGPALVCLLLDAGTDRATAVKRARDAAQQVWETSHA